MNNIQDIDGQNGKSGGRVLSTGLGLKSGVCGCRMAILCIPCILNSNKTIAECKMGMFIYKLA